MDNVSLRNIIHSKEKDTNGASADIDIQSQRVSGAAISLEEDTSKRKTSFATLPNTTTWQQQSVNYQQIDNNGNLFCYFTLNFSIPDLIYFLFNSS